jgi:molybdenum ABC transporter molybdate-binding protein
MMNMNFSQKLFALSTVAIVGLMALLAINSGDGKKGGEQQRLMMYCAAGVKPPVLKAAAEFEKRYGVKVDLQYGGSGTLLNNLQVAKTGDLYLAADASFTDLARQKGLLAESLPLAQMKPVIAVQRGNPKNIKSLRDLLRKDVRLSMGNPEAASIGKQAKKLLLQAGLWDDVKVQVEERGVFKPTVPEVANDIKIGAVDAGIIWDATAHQYDRLEGVEVPELSVAKKMITIGVLKSSQQATLALRFARYLNSSEGNKIFNDEGYQAVDGDQWAWTPEITFFCGSVNRRAVEGLLKSFSEREGVTINTIYNGCGILTAQMKTIKQDKGGSGFPDIYMACDRYYLNNVIDWYQEDIDISDTPIVIAVPEGNPNQVKTVEDLTKPGVKVAVGQCDQCTIGALTRTLLQKEGMYGQVQKNVATETATSSLLVPAVTTKSVDAAFAFYTDTLAESNKVDSISIPSNHSIAIQPFAIAKSSSYKHMGRRVKAAIIANREAFEKAGFNFRATQP